VHRFEQVRLANAVGARDEDDAGDEIELELWIRAEVSERDVRDDQPASLIGMIR
jgi:hypothetical protein